MAMLTICNARVKDARMLVALMEMSKNLVTRKIHVSASYWKNLCYFI